MIRYLILFALLWVGERTLGADVQFEPISLSSRLPTNVRPIAYDVNLVFPSVFSDSFTGSVEIMVAVDGVTHRGKNIYKRTITDMKYSMTNPEKTFDGLDLSTGDDAIILHKDPSLDVSEVKVYMARDGDTLLAGRQKEMKISKLGFDEKQQMMAILLRDGVPSGEWARIAIKFQGKMRPDKRGVYVSEYNDGSKVYRHIVSQVQPTDARSIFPCFDEPSMKARFTLSIVHQEDLIAYGNMDVESRVVHATNSLVRTTFRQSPFMPVHMLAFVVGQFDEPLVVESRRGGKVRQIRFIAEPGLRNSGKFALDVAKRSLEWMEQYVDFEYPLDKLDIVALADRDKDNTESWGLVFVRDVLAIVDDETKPDTKISTAVNVAHVVVHQWFANLVTASWWDDLWITEGVAANKAFWLVQHLYPEFQSEYFVRMATLSSVLDADASGTIHELSPPMLHSTQQAYELFDQITFMKSASLVQYMEFELEEENYREFLRILVRQAKYGNIDRLQFTRILDQVMDGMSYEVSWASEHIKDVIESVIESMIRDKGLAMIDTSYNHEDRTIVLTKMSPNGEAAPKHHWVQRVTLFFSDGAANKDRRLVVLNLAKKTVEVPSWFEPTPESGHYVKVVHDPDLSTYYRVRYSDELLRLLKNPIEQRSLSPMDRLHILDDAHSLVRRKTLASDTFKELVGWYANEEHGALIIELLLATRTLKTLKQTIPEPITEVFTNLYTKYGFRTSGSETFLDQRSRMVTLNGLVALGNENVIEEALATYASSKGNIKALFLREPIYAAVVARGSPEQVEQLVQRLNATKSYEEKLRLASALALSKDKNVRDKLWAWISTKSGFKPDVVVKIDQLSKSIAAQ